MVQSSKHIGVILVEDEALIRMLAAEALTDAGFVVIEAGTADEALVMLREQAKDFHVLFTDVHMPGSINGLHLAHHANQHWPWLAIIIASGKAQPGADELPANSRFFSKPYNLDRVVGHIKEIA